MPRLAGQFAGMNVNELLQPAFLDPVWQCGAIALVLWWAVWWREQVARSALPLAVMALAWAACHLAVNRHSYQFPPKPPEDWLVFGAAGLFVLALVAWWCGEKERKIPVGIISALVLAAMTWLALRHMPYLLDRNETPADRNLWTAAGIAGVLVTFLAAEWAARRVSAPALFAGLAIMAALAGLSLWRMDSPDRTAARPLAAAAVAAAGVIAALCHRSKAAVPRGLAGWFAGGVLLLLILGCLSRAANVPVWPMAAAAGVMPAAVLVLWVHGRLFLTGHGLTFIAAMLLAGTALYFVCACDAERIESAVPVTESTGADDTGAYD